VQGKLISSKGAKRYRYRLLEEKAATIKTRLREQFALVETTSLHRFHSLESIRDHRQFQRQLTNSHATLVQLLQEEVNTQFSGMLTSDLLFVEVFARTAGLCKATRELGMEVLPVDKTSAGAS